MQNRLFVGGLASDVTEIDLQEIFAEHGTVQDVNLVLDKVTRESRGFGFVTMIDEAAAQNAIRALDGYPLRGKTIKVSVARPREDRAPGAGGGGPRRRTS